MTSLTGNSTKLEIHCAFWRAFAPRSAGDKISVSSCLRRQPCVVQIFWNWTYFPRLAELSRSSNLLMNWPSCDSLSMWSRKCPPLFDEGNAGGEQHVYNRMGLGKGISQEPLVRRCLWPWRPSCQPVVSVDDSFLIEVKFCMSISLKIQFSQKCLHNYCDLPKFRCLMQRRFLVRARYIYSWWNCWVMFV